MANGGNRILDRVLDDMLCEPRPHSLSKSFCASAPLAGTVPQLLDPSAGSGANRGSLAEGIFYVARTIGMPAVFSGLRRGGQQERDSYEFRPHGMDSGAIPMPDSGWSPVTLTLR